MDGGGAAVLVGCEGDGGVVAGVDAEGAVAHCQLLVGRRIWVCQGR